LQGVYWDFKTYPAPCLNKRRPHENRYLSIKGDTVTINFNITLDIDDSILEEIDKLEDIKPN
jgi:hypothetical protein